MKIIEKLNAGLENKIETVVSIVFAAADLSKTADSIYGISAHRGPGDAFKVYFGDFPTALLEREMIPPYQVEDNLSRTAALMAFRKWLDQATGETTFVATNNASWTEEVYASLCAAHPGILPDNPQFLELRDLYSAWSRRVEIYDARTITAALSAAPNLKRKEGLDYIAAATGQLRMQAGTQPEQRSELLRRITDFVLNDVYMGPGADD